MGSPARTGLATWVVAHNEPALVRDEAADERVNQFRSTGPIDGSMICVPLRGRDGATGVLTLERLGLEQRFSEEEFELVQLFAAQVSIALQNAEVHRAVEIRAQTDDLTGLLNHGTFQDWLARDALAGEPFSLIMLDLDDFKGVNDGLGHQAGDRLLARDLAGARRRRPRHRPRLPLRRRRVRPDPAGRRRRRRAGRRRAGPRRGPRARRDGLGVGRRGPRGQRLDRRRDLPRGRHDGRGDPARRRPGLLRGEADRPRPDRDRRRGPRDRPRLLLQVADPDRRVEPRSGSDPARRAVGARRLRRAPARDLVTGGTITPSHADP